MSHESDWNLYLDAKLALDLTADEHRLADAIARSTLGYRMRREMEAATPDDAR